MYTAFCNENMEVCGSQGTPNHMREINHNGLSYKQQAEVTI